MLIVSFVVHDLKATFLRMVKYPGGCIKKGLTGLTIIIMIINTVIFLMI